MSDDASGPASGSGATAEGRGAFFHRQRSRLFGIAYRMLGSVAEAEDIVQEAYLRWHAADAGAVREPAAFLSTIVTRLSLDHLRSARVRRERYVGPWLPEPLIGSLAAQEVEEEPGEDDISIALFMALERLSPLERAAFLLHDVFGQSFARVAAALDRDEATCRQLAARARKHVRAAKPRYPVAPDEGDTIVRAFFAASRSGDMAALTELLSKDVVLHSDGGGHNQAALNPILGIAKVLRLYAGLARKPRSRAPRLLHVGRITGLPGFVSLERGSVLQATALEIRDGRIAAVYTMMNPEKLRHVAERFAGTA